MLTALSLSSCSSPEQEEAVQEEAVQDERRLDAIVDAIEATDLIGMWLMGPVLEDTSEVTDVHNPALNRWIELQQEGTFESGGAPYGFNSGNWSYDNEQGELYLDSDAGEEDDSYWVVHVKGDTMSWKGARTDFAKRFTITFKKKRF